MEEKAAEGLSGDWEIYVYMKDGAQMDLDTSSSQVSSNH